MDTVELTESPESAPSETPLPVPSAPVVSGEATSPEGGPPEAVSEPAAGTIRDHAGKFQRHRAKSQQAGAADVPRIAELTRKWRTAEETNKQLQARLETLERANAPKPAPLVPTFPQTTTETFTVKEPQLEDFADRPDPYAAMVRAQARYDIQKEAFDEKQKGSAQETQAARQAALGQVEKARRDFGEKQRVFMAQHPDYGEKIQVLGQNGHLNAPPVILAVITHADNGPELLYHLAQASPVEIDQMYTLFDGKPVDEAFVARAQRWLSSRVQAVNTTGPAAAVPQHLAPRPPTPVRTGTVTTSDDLPDDNHGVMAHARHWGKKSR